MSSSDKKVCFKCGRRYPCGTCGGTGRIPWCPECGAPVDCGNPQHSMQEMIDCPDCEDGWCALPKRKCGNCRFNTGSLPPPNSDRINCSLRRCILAGWPHYDHRCDDHDYMRGTDQAILCPACEEAK